MKKYELDMIEACLKSADHFKLKMHKLRGMVKTPEEKKRYALKEKCKALIMMDKLQMVAAEAHRARKAEALDVYMAEQRRRAQQAVKSVWFSGENTERTFN